MLTLIIVSAFVLLIVCVADKSPDRKPPKGYCCWSLWDYGTCTCADRDANVGR